MLLNKDLQEVDFYGSPENVGKAYANEVKAHRFISIAAIDQVRFLGKSWYNFENVIMWLERFFSHIQKFS